MKNILRLVAAAAILSSLAANAAHTGTSRHDNASERYIERVIDRYVTAYGNSLDGDANADAHSPNHRRLRSESYSVLHISGANLAHSAERMRIVTVSRSVPQRSATQIISLK